MDTPEFIDLMYQLWAKTTWANDGYWKYEPDELGGTTITVVNSENEEELVGEGFSNSDAEFVTAIHGCFRDLVWYIHDTESVAERLDVEADDREVRLAAEIESHHQTLRECDELWRENQNLWEQLGRMEDRL